MFENSEKLLSLGEAARLLPGVVNPMSVWRWCRKGLRGVQLEFVRVGGRIYVTTDQLKAFVAATTKADKARYAARTETAKAVRAATKRPTSSRRKKQVERAVKQLASSGC